MRFEFCICVTMLSGLGGCSRESSQSGTDLFQLLSPEETHISFSNKIEDNDSINILTYEYLYNGGGVGILDINNDGLNDIFFTGSHVANALYLNKGNFLFEDISESAGVELKGEWCTGVSVIDINSDGYDDIYVCVGGMGNKSVYPNKLFINEGDMTFKEMAKEYGLADPGESIQAVFFDYDRDHDLDMYLLTGGGFERSAIMPRPILEKGESRNTDQLYRNTYDSMSGHVVFANVSTEAGILHEGFGLGVSIVDANQDSWPDVYVSNDYLTRDNLYVNNHDGTFTDRSLEFFKHTSHFSMGNDAGDINNDGLQDIITLDMLPEDHRRKKLMFGPNQQDVFYLAVQRNYGYQYMRNMLQLSRGNDSFSEIGQLAGIYQTDWSWAPLLADFDNDGYQDLYITNGYGKDITDLDFVKFRKDAVSPFSDRKKIEKLFLDSLRMRPSITLPNYIYKNEKDLTFSNQSANWGFTQSSISNGAAYADLDNDGDLDIVVNNINQVAFVYKNNLVEKDSLSSGFLKVKLKGPLSNKSGIGSNVSIHLNGEMQFRNHQVVHGFQSSVENTIHLGVGTSKNIDSVVVKWPDGKVTSVKNVAVNQLITVAYADAVNTRRVINDSQQKYFSPVNLIDFKHNETSYDDFKTQALLLHGFSNQGPGIAVADVNGDGLDDFFIGGAYGSSGTIFIQTAKNSFQKKSILDDEYEDLGAVFFDADGDKDIDLYVASGGSERYANHKNYQDRLYLNDGKGNFNHDVSALPPMLSSKSVVAAGDYDQDGDMDLFVGGRVTPGEYPKIPESYILQNQDGKFVDVTDKLNTTIKHIGMVTTALWTDFNNDSLLDLVIAGESMRITFLKNNDNSLVDITDQTSLKETYGMWNSLVPGDFDNDGDTDFIAGNLGLNNPFKVTPEKPLEVYYADFDNSGSIEPIFSYYDEGQAYPIASLDQLAGQLPSLKKFLLHYRDYAKTTTHELLNLTNNNSYEILPCKVLASSFIENLGNDQFLFSSLPVEVQFGPVNGIVAEDINMDGLLDLIMVGNSFGQDVVHGRYDASVGSVLINHGSNNFKSFNFDQTSFEVKGDARAMARIELSNGNSGVLVTQNNDSLKLFTINNYRGAKRVRIENSEVMALLSLSDGSRRKIEFTVGGSYLSQSSKSIVSSPSVELIEFFDSKGNKTREIQTDKNSIQR